MRIAIGAGLVCLIIAYRIFAFDGYYGWDDIAYTEYAVQLLNGNLSMTDPSHFVYRWGIIVPLAISYQYFGINDISTTLPPLLATIGTLFLLYRISRRADSYTAVCAMLLFAFDYYTLCYALRPYADVLISFFSMLMLYPLLVNYGYQTLRWQHALSVSVGFFLCWISKETALFFVPLLCLWAVYDFYQCQNRRFWSYVAASSFVLFVAYFAFIAYQTGTWSYRFDRIAANYYFNPCSYHLLPFSVLWHRITTGLLELFVCNGMIIAMMWAWVSLAPYSTKRFQSPEQLPEMATTQALSMPEYTTNNNRQWVFVVLFLTFYYMPVSYKHYIPMCLDGRHFLPLIPIGALAAAPALAGFFRYGYYALPITSVVTAIAILSVYVCGDKNMSLIYAAIALLCWANTLIKKQMPRLYIATFALILAIHPFYTMLRPTATGYALQTKLVKQYLLKNTERQLVICDDLNENIGKYYTQFVANPNTFFINYADYCPEMLQEGNYKHLYILSNEYTNRAIEQRGYNVPNYMRQTLPNMQAIVDTGGIRIWQLQPANL